MSDLWSHGYIKILENDINKTFLASRILDNVLILTLSKFGFVTGKHT